MTENISLQNKSFLMGEMPRCRSQCDDCKDTMYNGCAGKDCRHKATTVLKIKYLHKTGHFCTNCATDLLELGLVELEYQTKER
jgi:hypothetical protein